MDTSIPGNSTLIARVRKEAAGSGYLEAFLESAPQFILQCTFILLTGNASEFNFNYHTVSFTDLGNLTWLWFEFVGTS